MPARFDSFVILAGMRTGSNFLEANLNEYAGLKCHGELFNPHFIGHAKCTELFGMTLAEREVEPMRLVARARERTAGLAGFRLFEGHDPRVLAAVLTDGRVAKILLSRNPLDSYVSLKIAGETRQWRLGDMKDARSARIAFDASEFDAYRAGVRAFNEDILRRLQESGQAAFCLSYEDVSDVSVMNGLARFLGLEEERNATSSRTKKQNPEDLRDKVTNYDEMAQALAAADPFDLSHQPVFEPRRGPVVPQFVAAATAPLMYLPIRGGPVAEVEDWLLRAGGGELRRNFTQKAARHWLRDQKGHRLFTVLRHPVPRLYDTFCRHILHPGPEAFAEIREVLSAIYGLELPGEGEWDAAAQRRAFLGFVRFVNGNLAGQTSVRVDPGWASQAAILQGMAQFAMPDLILREEELATALPSLAASVGAEQADWRPDAQAPEIPLDAIYDDEVEAQLRQAYQRDYMMFGFRPWRR